MRYPAYEPLISPARPKSEFWRLGLGVGLCFVLYLIGATVYTQLVAAMFSVPIWAVAVGLTNGAQPEWTLAMLFSFTAMALAPMIVVKWLHQRPVQTLFGPLPSTVRDGVRVVVAIAILQVVLEILPPWDAYGAVRNAALTVPHWLALLPLSLLGVLIQTGAEELFFRGYLQSQLAARFRSPLVWMLIPSALFAAGHYDPVMMGENALWITAWAFAFGMLAADLTARTGSLGAAIGFHFANNVYAMIIIGFPDNFGGLALYHLPFTTKELEPTNPLILLDFAIMLTAWLAARVALRR
ncbi:CPBP family intramembrane glutamic endopeptidase [Aliiroseovarius sp. YM-037]|uniref:CPBP family intramembrane glutamic endopeptidase n=1 Tax=Aliiroseovarius sp. YM-037 TaxID=3341728 RepID=UPI003A80841A